MHLTRRTELQSFGQSARRMCHSRLWVFGFGRHQLLRQGQHKGRSLHYSWLYQSHSPELQSSCYSRRRLVYAGVCRQVVQRPFTISCTLCVVSCLPHPAIVQPQVAWTVLRSTTRSPSTSPRPLIVKSQAASIRLTWTTTTLLPRFTYPAYVPVGAV